jgi:hypothetical protein
MRTLIRARLACLCAILATSIVGSGARAADRPLASPVLNDVLARIGDYVNRYERELSGIVAEEHYRQDSDALDRPFLTHRDLKSDLLLVRASGAEGEAYVQFRDVYEVDGDPVRDRGERLLKLFLEPSSSALQQAGQIMSESSRYNIGSIERNINVPLLALMFMHPTYQRRFKFSMSTEDRSVPKGLPRSGHFTVSVDVRVVSFKETSSPTIVRGDGNAEARSHGRVWVDPGTGRILMTELIVESAVVVTTIQVSYQAEPLVGFLVPVEMHETYVIPKRKYRIEGTATYGNFRQFTVKTNEKVQSVKDQP